MENNQLILSIGNLLFNKVKNNEYFKPSNDINSLSQSIEDFINNSDEKIKIFILKNFLDAKELYFNYDNNELLLLDDINLSENKQELFTDKYPSLINYLNCNQDIYKSLKSIPEIFKFKTSLNCIPLWLVCLRTLANSNNIKLYFEYTYNIIIHFEKELQNKIHEKIKYKYNDIYWVLLISPNYHKILNNEYFEKMYKFFNFLLYEIANINSEKQN